MINIVAFKKFIYACFKIYKLIRVSYFYIFYKYVSEQVNKYENHTLKEESCFSFPFIFMCL